MTGWQTAEGHSPSYTHHPQHHEAMELSRIVSQLAMANQQLASAHSLTLAHMEALYAELRKERDARRREVTSTDVDVLDEGLKKRLTDNSEDDSEEAEERQRLERRIGRLECLLAENHTTCYNRQRNLRHEEVRKLQYRIERLESAMKTQGLIRIEGEDVRCTESFSRVENPDDPTFIASCKTHHTEHETVPDRIFNNSHLPEHEVENEDSKSQVETVDKDRAISFSNSTSLDEEAENFGTREEPICLDTNSHLTRAENEAMKSNRVKPEANSAERKEIMRLSEEIERLKAERLEYQSTNERLLSDLITQKRTIEQLTQDCEESKARQEKAEAGLTEHREEYNELMKKFDVGKQEIEGLLGKIEACNLEKDTAEARISSLEQDLEKSLMEKEQIKNTESQKNSKLKAQLSEEVSDKKKQVKALEDSLVEIQRLKETIKTERKNSDDEASREENGESIESIDEVQQGSSLDRTANLEEFKKELTMKREARQRAIAAVSSEMERLRRELDAEKEAHSETSRMLELLRSAQGDAQAQDTANITTDGRHRRSRMKDQKPDEHEIAIKRTEAQRLTNILKVSDELKNDIRLQIEKVDDLRYHLETEPEQHQYRIRCLTEVTNKTREALGVRERRANQLKDHLAQILVRLGDRSFLDLKDDVGAECERQLENINSLKSLYNERLKVLTELKDAAVKELADVKERLDYSLKKSECLEEDLKKADEKIDAQDTEISNLESQLGLAKADCRDLQNQMSLINGLFTQMLLGASSADMDLDRLTQLLQENHDLISDMAREEGTEAAALPKLLLDLIEQVEGSKGLQKRPDAENHADSEVEKKEDDLQQEDIAHNLPKVWRVLLELLSCHAVGAPSASAVSCSDPNSCYKSVDTPAGPRLVISVSKTYIRLKELILEKKHLEKEMNRMKQLNAHLECKLGEQEKKLSAVSAELTKTWNIVGRMQAQHQQLHTHEKILRYELQQKRKMLQELKQELEYCREKWESARQKNTNTELEWRSLRREFAARKALAVHDSFNNSGESGFSDERGDDSDEEDEAVEGRIRLGPRRRARKESPRAPTPDTESEQPTDTELSEPKTGSSATLEQRTPTPETEGELDEMEVADADLDVKSENTTETVSTSASPQESLDPLDQALTNVIQNLIKLDNNSKMDMEFSSSEQTHEETENVNRTEESVDHTRDSESQEKKEVAEGSSDKESISLPSTVDNAPSPIATDYCQNVSSADGEKAKSEESPKSSVSHVPITSSTNLASTMPVFSIGPFPQPSVTPSSVKSVQFSDPLIVGPSNRFFAPVFGTPTPEFDGPSDNTSTSPAPDRSTPNRESHETEPKISGDRRACRSSESVSDSDNISVDSSSSLETVKESPATVATVTSSPMLRPSTPTEQTKKPKETSPEVPATTSSSQQGEPAAKPTKMRTPEEALAAREDRLKRLEEQAQWLMKKMNATSRRGSALSSRLEELHEVYGEPPVPPPMPDVLPSRRLRTNLTDLPREVPESSSAKNTKNIERPVPRRDSGESQPDNAP